MSKTAEETFKEQAKKDLMSGHFDGLHRIPFAVWPNVYKIMEAYRSQSSLSDEEIEKLAEALVTTRYKDDYSVEQSTGSYKIGFRDGYKSASPRSQDGWVSVEEIPKFFEWIKEREIDLDGSVWEEFVGHDTPNEYTTEELIKEWRRSQKKGDSK